MPYITCVEIHVSMNVRVFVYICICVYIYIHWNVCTRVHICMCICALMYFDICPVIYIHIYIYCPAPKAVSRKIRARRRGAGPSAVEHLPVKAGDGLPGLLGGREPARHGPQEATQTEMHAYTCVYIYIYTHTCICVCYIYMYTCLYFDRNTEIAISVQKQRKVGI